MISDGVDQPMLTRISRTGLNRIALIGTAIILLLAITFSQLPLRAQGRIVEVLTLDDWPLEWAVRRQFARKQAELRSIIDFVDEAPSLAGLTVTPTGVRASHSEDSVEKGVIDNPGILDALVSIEADAVNVHEDRVSVLLGVENRGRSSFEVAYIYPLKPVDQPRCETISAMKRSKIGACVVELSSHWYASYQWYPTDVEELQKALDEFN